MTAADAKEGLRLWKRAAERHLRLAEKLAWLDENPGDPEWEALLARTLETAAKTAATRGELQEWLGVVDPQVLWLLGEFETMQAGAWA